MLEQHDLRLIDRFKHNEQVRAVFAAKPASAHSIAGERIDVQLLIVSSHNYNTLHYYIEDGDHIQERWLCETDLNKRLIQGTDEELVTLIKNSRIVVDKDTRATQLQKMILDFSDHYREQKLFVEF